MKVCKARFEEFGTAGKRLEDQAHLSLTAEMAKRYASGELDPKFG